MDMIKFSCVLFALGILAFFGGCQVSNVPASTEALADIPTYSPLARTYDTSAKLSVYNSLRFANDLASELSKAGYVISVDSDFLVKEPVHPDFIVDQLAFNNWTQTYHGELWLFTRIAVVVRRPARTDGDGNVTYGGEKPRLFQAYARSNLGRCHAAVLANYRANEKVATQNLLLIPEFRSALEVKNK